VKIFVTIRETTADLVSGSGDDGSGSVSRSGDDGTSWGRVGSLRLLVGGSWGRGGATAVNDLTLLGSLAQSCLQVNAPWKLSIFTITVLDKVNLWVGGVSRYFDNLLVNGTRALAQEVHQGLLLGGGGNDWARSLAYVRGAHEYVVVMDLRIREVPGWCVGDLHLRGLVEVQVPGDHWSHALAIALPDRAFGAGGV